MDFSLSIIHSSWHPIQGTIHSTKKQHDQLEPNKNIEDMYIGQGTLVVTIRSKIVSETVRSVAGESGLVCSALVYMAAGKWRVIWQRYI